MRFSTGSTSRRVAALAIVAERPAVLATAPLYARQAPRARRAPVAAAFSTNETLGSYTPLPA
jgi:hypothetical protein